MEIDKRLKADEDIRKIRKDFINQKTYPNTKEITVKYFIAQGWN